MNFTMVQLRQLAIRLATPVVYRVQSNCSVNSGAYNIRAATAVIGNVLPYVSNEACYR